MRNFIPLSTCWMLMLFLVGCVEPQTQELQSSSEPEVLVLKRETIRLKKSNRELERENIVLKNQVAKLTTRERALSKKVADIQFELDRREEQVEALADVPAERDRLKKEVAALKSQVVKLQLKLEEAKTRSD